MLRKKHVVSVANETPVIVFESQNEGIPAYTTEQNLFPTELTLNYHEPGPNGFCESSTLRVCTRDKMQFPPHALSIPMELYGNTKPFYGPPFLQYWKNQILENSTAGVVKTHRIVARVTADRRTKRIAQRKARRITKHHR